MPISVKIQYKTFEPGEFTAKKDRTFQETITLIEQFPWTEQRDHLQVSLTNPSITMEDPAGNYLKIALYYEGKFVLHYFNNQKHLYTKSFTSYTDAVPYIQSFYQGSLDLNTMKRENTWGQHPSLHFIDQDFHYTSRNAWRLPNILTPLIITAGGIMILVMSIIQGPAMHLHIYRLIPFLLLIGVPFSTYTYLFLNHYLYIRNQLLILSKGNDIFYYGNKNAPEKFDKKEIVEITTYGATGRSGSQADFLRVTIHFKNGHSLDLSTLLIDKYRLLDKFAGYSFQQVSILLPFMPPSASAPS